ncbi:MAG: TonB-dependent receptor [Chitinophagaceae bacterium]|nr:TonB-dependent receptor [Chitinophagaceae bacterium]
MKRSFGLAIVFALLWAPSIQAQVRELAGKITDAKSGLALEGVTVQLKGSTQNTITLADGSFHITIQTPVSTVIFSHTGYEEQEAAVGANMNIALVPSVSDLSEVVVVGYGKSEKRDLTGSISHIKGSEVENLPVASFESGLQGKAAGLNIESGSGKLGQAIKVRIRGTSSISASSQPLYVVDGLPVITTSLSDGTNEETNPLVDLNPNDIESIEVLKDASAAAIYGARAANGVILVTTKKGKMGKKSTVNVNLSTGFSNPTRKKGFMNTQQYAQLYDQALLNDATYDFNNGISGYSSITEALESLTSYLNTYYFNPQDYALGAQDWKSGEINTNWEDLQYNKNAQTQQADVSVSGGTDKTKFYASGFYNKQEAIVINNVFQRYGGRLNLDHNISDKVSIGFNLALNRSQLDRVSHDNAFSTPGQMVAQLPFSPTHDPETGKLNPYTLYANGLFDAQFSFEKQVTFRSFGNAYANIDIAPSLAFRSELGADILNLYQEYYSGKESTDGKPLGLGGNLFSQSASLNTNNYFTFSPSIGSDHTLKATAGMSYLQNDLNQSAIQGEGYPSDAIKNLSGATDIVSGSSTGARYSFLSYFARANYALLDKYLVSASLRADGSSRFSPENRYGLFPAASIGWILSEESFLRNSSFLSYFKLRASYGITGNAEIGENGFLGLYQVSNYPSLPGYVPNQLPSKDLRWEKTAQADIGAEFGFWNNRLSGEIDLYHKKTTDLLLNVNIPSSTGFSSILENLGKMENKGVELTLNSRNLVGKFSWNTSFNIAYNKNTVLDIQGQVIESGGGLQRAVDNQPIGVFYMQHFVGVDPENGDALYEDADGKPTSAYQDAVRKVVGKALPDFTGALTNTLRYANFDLSIQFNFVEGNSIFNAGGIYSSSSFGNGYDNQTTDQLNGWKQPGDITNVPRAGMFYSTGYRNSSRWLYDGSYIRLRNLVLGYTLPSSITGRWKMSSARFYLSGMNLLTFTKYIGDPEVNTYVLGNISGGQDFFSIPQARTIAAGVNIRF